MTGEITLYYGDKYSTKTSALIKALIREGEGSICFKHINDGDDYIISHCGIEFPATTIENASEIFLLLDYKITTIGIVISEFFENDITLISTIIKLRDSGYYIVLSDTTSSNTFLSSYLSSIADNCIKLNTSGERYKTISLCKNQTKKCTNKRCDK